MKLTKLLPASVGFITAAALLGGCSFLKPNSGYHYGASPHGNTHYGTTHRPSHYGAKRHNKGYTYGSVGAVMYDVDNSSYGVQGRLGYQFSNVLGTEVEGSTAVTDAGTAPDVDYQLAGFGIAKLPVNNRLSFRARGGYHTTDLGTTEDGFAYGAGLEYALTNRDAIRLDYTNYEIDAGPNLDSLSIAYQRRF